MREPLILTFDCGTQSIRALLFNKQGDLVAATRIKYQPYYSENPGWAEQDPELYWQKLCEVSQMLKSENEELFKDIIAVTVTTMRDTGVYLDKNLNIVRPTILWLDTRRAVCDKPLPIKSTLAFKMVGMSECVQFSRENSKTNWVIENQPEVWEKTDKFLMLSGYLTYKLTGNILDSIASQVGHLPFDYRNKKWMKKSNVKYPIFGIEIEKLPDLVNPGESLGVITPQAAQATGINAGLKLIATGSDKGCETLGTGVVAEDIGSLSFGTTSTIQLCTKKYVEPQQFLPAYPSAVKGYYNPEIEIFRGYWMLSWFKNEFAHKEVLEGKRLNISPEELFNRRLQEVPRGSEGLILQPYWGPGLKNPEARGSIIGFNAAHTRIHIYRAIIEGINFALRDGLEILSRRAGANIKKLAVSGGGSQNDMVCQITADMFGLDIFRAQTYETSGLGSSVLGFTGMGEFESIESAIENMVHYTNVFKPEAEGYREYDKLYNDVYKQIYPRLKPLYHNLKDIGKNK